MEKKLNIRNTVLKIVADQTLAAGINSVAFLGILPALRGGSAGQVWEGIKQVSRIGADGCDSDEAGRSPTGDVWWQNHKGIHGLIRYSSFSRNFGRSWSTDTSFGLQSAY